MTKEEKNQILELAEEDYKEALKDKTFVSPYDAAREAAKNCIVAEVWKHFGIAGPRSFARREDVKDLIWELWTEFEDKGVAV